MKTRSPWQARLLAAAAALSVASTAHATTYYVSTTGSDAAAGTSTGAAYATIAKAVSSAAKGDTILVRGGTYALSSTLSIGSSKSGTAAQPYTLAAYGDGAVTLDFSAQAAGQRGVQLNASYWTIRGITVANAKDNGINISGSYNTIDRVVTRNNQDSGVQISGGGAAYNLIKNVDSHSNYDPAAHGENADGFAAKFRDLGAGNVFDGCRAWNNSDDGWDFWGAAHGVTVKNSYAFKNGFNTFGDTDYEGDGNGLKLGHDSGPHVLTNNLVWGNRLNGIDVNGNALALEEDTVIAHGVTLLNNTAYNNGAGRNGYNYNFDEAFAHVLRNNVALSGGTGNANMTGGVDHTFNTWNGIVNVTAADFLSLLDTVAAGDRLADGSLPVSDFLRLAATSDLINAGTSVGLPFNGDAPDLGAFETAVPEPASLGVVAAVGAIALRRRTRR